MADDLIIRISGDVANYKAALEEAKEKTSDLSGALGSIALVSGVAFAALTAEAYTSVKAFAEVEQGSIRLTAALQQQGIYSKELVTSYQDIANAIENKTGRDADNTIAIFASQQAMLGQTKITKGLAMAVEDFAVAKLGGDLAGAWRLVTQGATVSTAMLKRHGIEVEDTGTRAGNLAAIQKALADKFTGTAEAASGGLGSITKLKTAFDNVQEAIGERLAPVVTQVIGLLTDFFKFINDHPALVDFAVSLGVAAAAVTGLITALATGAIAFIAIQAAMVALGVTAGATAIAVTALAGATGIGLLAIVATEVYLNWNSVWPRVQAVFAAAATSIAEIAKGLGGIIKGIFTLDPATVDAGVAQMVGALSAGMTKYNDTLQSKLKDRQAIEDKAEADKAAKNNANAAAEEAKLREKENRALLIAQERRKLLTMQAQGESADAIAIQNQEIALLEAVNDDKNKKIVAKLLERYAQLKALAALNAADDLGRESAFNSQILAEDKQFQDLSSTQKLQFLEQNRVALQASIDTEATARRKAALDQAKIQIDANNKFLQDQLKFGTGYATINKAMHSEIFTQNAQAFQDLAALQNSSNSTLKAIGKAAAVANIAVQTANSAMNIFAGFSQIPIVGYALGIAGAAAAVAFGAEQTSNVLAAADGGLVTGGMPGRDSVPAMLMPGELVVPQRNFDEVVGAVKSERGADGAGVGGQVTVQLSLKDKLVEFVEAKIVQRQNIGVSLLRA